MTGYEAYVMFLSMKRHFTPGSDYDYVKYKGRVNVKPSTYENQGKSCFLFEKLGRHRDLERFLASILSRKPKAWVGDLFTDEAEAIYNEYVRVTESLTYCLKRDMSQFDPWLGFDDLFRFGDDGYPPALEALLDGRMLVEILCSIDDMVGGSITRHWAKRSWDPIVKLEVHRIQKLRPFVPYDSSLRETVKNLFVDASAKPSLA